MNYHRLHGYKLLYKLIAKVKGKGKFRTPPTVVPKRLNGFSWNLEYITKSLVWPYTQIHVALRQRGWSRRTCDVTCFGFLVDFFYFFTFFLYSWDRAALSPVDRFWRSTRHLMYGESGPKNTSTMMWFSGVPLLPLPIYGIRFTKTQFLGVNQIFQAYRGKYWKVHIIKTTTSIPAKFCTTLKTTKWVVQISPQQLQVHKLADGRHFENVKSPCLRNCLTDFAEIWHDDAYWPHTEDRPLQSKISALVILKITKIAISQQWTDRSSRNLASWYNMGLLTMKTVKKWISKVQHGGRPPNLRNRLTDFDEIWHADAEPVS